MTTYTITTNDANNINDFAYQIVRQDDLIVYQNKSYGNVKDYARMIELENRFANRACELIYLV